jgi:hypothetical protein
MKKEESIGNQRRSDRAAGRVWRRTWWRRTSRLPLPLWPPPYHSSHCDCQLPHFPCSSDASSLSHASARSDTVAVVEDASEVELRPRKMVEPVPHRREEHRVTLRGKWLRRAEEQRSRRAVVRRASGGKAGCRESRCGRGCMSVRMDRIEQINHFFLTSGSSG